MEMNQMPGMDARTRKLKFWLFGIFVLAFAAVTAVLGAVSGGSLGLIFGQLNYWLMIAIVAVLCIIAYFVLNAVGKK
jgi:uncharacterized membrane protein YhaH (DUF805 family)